MMLFYNSKINLNFFLRLKTKPAYRISVYYCQTFIIQLGMTSKILDTNTDPALK